MLKGTARSGYYDPVKRKIVLARLGGISGRRFSAYEREYTFWHEATHAILHDMGDDSWRNERFVTSFSKRLCTLVRSMRKVQR